MASRIPRLWHSRPAFKTILANTRSYSSVDASFEPPVSRLRDRIKSYWPAFLAWTVFGSEALHLLWLRQDYKNYKEKTTTRISILNDVITKMENGQHVDLENALYIGDFRERSSSTPIDTVDYSSAADDKDWIKLFDQAAENDKVQHSPSSPPLQSPKSPSSIYPPPASSSYPPPVSSSSPPSSAPASSPAPSSPRQHPDTSKFY